MNQQSQMMHPQPHLHAPPQHPQQYRQQQPQPPTTTTGIVLSNNLVIFLAVAGLCGYTVYTTGNLQHFIYAVSALYVLRLFLRNPEILKQLHAQIQSLQGQYYHRGLVPVATVSPVPARVSPPPMNHATLAASAPAPGAAHHHTQEMHSAVPVHPQEPLVAPRLDMNFLDQVRPDGYQPLPARLPNIDEFDAPFTPIPSYSSSSYNPAIGSPQGANNHQRRIPSRSASRAESRIAAVSGIVNNATPENYPQRNQAPSRSLYDANAGALPSSNNLANLTPAAAAAARVAAAVAAMRPDSRMSDFAMPIQNPYGSYSHYDAGTINGQRLAALSEDAHHQQQQLERPPSVSEIIAAPPSQRSASAGSTSRVSPRSNTIAVSAPTATAPVNVNKDEFVPKRKHRVPTMSARVGEVFAPGAGIAPPPPHGIHESPVKFFNSPLVNSPSASSSHQHQQNGYESDSSHASSSSSSSGSRRRSPGPGDSTASATSSSSPNPNHVRTESVSSLGLPTYEKHATTIVTLNPKRLGYVNQIQAILKTSRTSWLTLPGSVSHEVGHDEASGSVVVVETYETSEAMEDYEKSKQREAMLDRLKTFVDESKTTVVRLPGSSAATRLIR